MNKYIIVSLLVGILIGFGVGYVCFWWINLKEELKSEWHGKIGIFYYVWYDPADPNNWAYPKIIDKPVLGYYNSCDSQVITQHLNWLMNAHIDFIIVSWWGHYNQTEWNSFINNATLQLFETSKEIASNVKIAIMVEPFNKTGIEYNYSEIYDKVYEFYQTFPSVYYKVEDKPLILFFNNETLTPNGNITTTDDRFTVKICGTANYSDWVYEDITTTVSPVPRNQQIDVIPRFNQSIDPKLDYLYKEKWERALNYAKNNQVKYITITSWNEYPERTAIEPHYDPTASNNDPFYLYNLTCSYITQLKGLETSSPKWYDDPKNFAIITILIILCVLVAKWFFGKI